VSTKPGQLRAERKPKRHRYVEDDHTEPGNIWSIPTDLGFPLAAAILLIAYGRLSPIPPAGSTAAGSP